ncbi:unnamed protein product [Ectocarpus sp. 8 AP-2014]
MEARQSSDNYTVFPQLTARCTTLLVKTCALCVAISHRPQLYGDALPSLFTLPPPMKTFVQTTTRYHTNNNSSMHDTCICLVKIYALCVAISHRPLNILRRCTHLSASFHQSIQLTNNQVFLQAVELN